MSSLLQPLRSVHFGWPRKKQYTYAIRILLVHRPSPKGSSSLVHRSFPFPLFTFPFPLSVVVCSNKCKGVSLVTLQEVKEILDAEVIVGEDRMGLEISKGACADMMSDVLVFGRAGSLLLTGLINPQVVRTAHILDIAAIVIARGKRPFPEMIRLAEELEIPILTTRVYPF